MKTFWKILITVVLTVGIVGGGTYYFMHKKATTDKNNLQAQINVLDSKMSAIRDYLANSQDVSTWETYSNQKFGFSFKYPRNLVVSSESSDSVSLAPGVGDHWVYEVEFTSSNKSLADEVAAQKQNGFLDQNAIGTSIKIGGTDAFKFNLNPGDYGNLLIIAKNNSTLLKIDGDTSDSNFDTTSSTFQFTK